MVSGLVLLSVFPACKKQITEEVTPPLTQESIYGEDVSQERGDVFTNMRVKHGNLSVINFDKALKAYESKSWKESANFVREGANALVNEGKFLNSAGQQKLQDALIDLFTIASRMEKGETIQTLDLQRAFAKAQVAVVQQYVVGMDEYKTTIPVPSVYYPSFVEAIQSVKNATPYLTGKAQVEAEKLVRDGENLIDQMNNFETVTEDQINAHRAALESFLKLYDFENSNK